MPERPRRLALLATLALIAVALVPALPAAAEDAPPTPDPVPTETASPSEPPAEVEPAPGASAALAPGVVFPGGAVGTVIGPPLQAVTSGWPTGTTFTYRWYRGATAIAGALGGGVNYVPIAADTNQLISVRATTTNLVGYDQKTVASTPENLTLTTAPGAISTLTGPAVVGDLLTPGYDAVFSYFGEELDTSNLKTTWYSNGAVVAGDSDGRYTVKSSDVNKRITARVTAIVPGHPPVTLPLSAPTAVVIKGSITASGGVSLGANSATGGLLLTASVPNGIVTSPDQATVTIAYQWFRVVRGSNVATPIAGATKSTFQITAAYAPYKIAAHATVSKAGYTSAVLLSVNYDATLFPYAAPVLAGGALVGATLTAQGFTWKGKGDDVTPDTVTVQWLRNGVAVPASLGGVQTSAPYTYIVKPGDLGTTLGYRVTALKAFFIPSVQSIFLSSKVVAAQLPNTPTTPSVTVVTISGSSGLELQVGSVPWNANVTPFGTATVAIQWMRDSKAISGATKVSYFPNTALDADHLIWARLTYTKPGYAMKVVTSAGVDYGLYGTTPTLTGEFAVGELIYVAPRTFSAGSGVVQTYQWYRNGVAVPIPLGGGAANYELSPGDRGKKISVKVTSKHPGLLTETKTTSSTQPIGDHSINGWTIPAPGLVYTNMSVASTNTVVASGLASCGTCKMAYQWYRNGAAIPQATKTSYNLVAADWGKNISLRVVTTKAADSFGTYTTNVRYSVPKNWSTTIDLPFAIDVSSGGGAAVGGQLQVPTKTVSANGTTLIPGQYVRTLRWYRNGVALSDAAGGNASTFTPRQVDTGAKFTLKATYGQAGGGSIPFTVTSPAVTIAPGTFAGAQTPAITHTAGSNVLGVSLGLYPVTPTFKYQWYLAGAAISGATKSTFAVPASMRGLITVKVTVSATGYLTRVLPISSAIRLDIDGIGGPSIGSGSSLVGDLFVASASGITYLTIDGEKTPTVKVQWYRNGVAISGGIGTTYRAVAADQGKKLTVRVIASLAGYSTWISPPSAETPPVGFGILSGAQVSVGNPSLSRVLSASCFAQTAPAGLVKKYRWLRGALAISSATKSTYTLTPSVDTDKEIRVECTLTAPGYYQAISSSAPTNYTLQEDGSGFIGGSQITGDELTAVTPTFSINGTNVDVDPTAITVQWYRNGVAISGKTGGFYTVVTADVGKTLTARVTARYQGYIPRTVTLTTDPG